MTTEQNEKQLVDEIFEEISSLCSIKELSDVELFKRETSVLVRTSRKISLRASNPYFLE